MEMAGARLTALLWLRTTQAMTSSSRTGSGAAITATWPTAGWPASAASTSSAAMFSPARRMMFLRRSTKCSAPSGPRRTTSPVWNQPGLPHQELSAFFVYQDLQRWRRAADAARADMPRLAARRDQRPPSGLGHRPGLDQRKAEALLERGVVRGIGISAVAEAHAMRLIKRCLR